MEIEEKRPEVLSILPRVEKEVLESLPDLHDDLGQDGLNGAVGFQQGELYRHALVEAERLRQAGADPGDALLLGVRMAHSSMEAQAALSSFRQGHDVDGNVIDLSRRRQPQLELVTSQPEIRPKGFTWLKRWRQTREQRRTVAASSAAILTTSTLVVLQTLRNNEPSGDDAA